MSKSLQIIRFFQSEKGRGKLNCLAASAAEDIHDLLQKLPAETDRSPKEWLARTFFPSVHREWNSKVEKGNVHPIPEYTPPAPPEENCVGWQESQED